MLRRLADECIAYHLDSDEALLLNATAALVVRLCDGSRTLAQISAEIGRLYSLPAGEIEDDVRHTVFQLAAQGFLEREQEERAITEAP